MSAKVRVATRAVLCIVTIGLGIGHPSAGRVAHATGPERVERASPFLIRPSFHPNVGQFPAAVRYAATARDGRLYLTDDEAVAVLAGRERSHAIRWGLVGARPQPPQAEERSSGLANYLVGDRSRWRAGIPTFGRVRYAGALDGVDIVYYGRPGGIEFDLELAPAADPRAIAIRIQGAASVATDPGDGSLVMKWVEGELRWQAPVAYQQHGPERRSVPVRYALRQDGTVGFDVGTYDRARPLVIDPVLLSSTFAGGTGADSAGEVAVDPENRSYLAGSTRSLDFPTTSGAFDTGHGGGNDAFVARISADGASLDFATFLGGNGDEGASGIALDRSGNIYVTGSTTSPDFPAVNAYQPAYLATRCTIFSSFSEPCRDAFVTKLSANGGAVLYSTFFGGTHHDAGVAIDLSDTGEAFVLGTTQSGDLPLVNPVDSTYVPSGCGAEGFSRRCPDPFVVKLAASGSTVHYSTYLGGDFDETAGDIVVDDLGRATVVGGTNSSNFPVANPIQPARAPGSCGVTPAAFLCFDVFVSRIAAAGGVLEFSTYFGGNGDDRAAGVALAGDESVWVSGHTTSTNLPLVNPLQPALAGPSPADSHCLPTAGSAILRCPDVLVARFDPTGSALLLSTYLGGVRRDEARAIALDSTGRVAVAGLTQSLDFPVSDAWQWDHVPSFGCGPLPTLPCADAFITLLEPGGDRVVYSTYLGSFDNDTAEGLAAAPDGSLLVSGSTGTAFPTTPGSLRVAGSGSEGFVARFASPPGEGTLVTFAGTGMPGTVVSPAAQALRTSFGVLLDVAVHNYVLRYVADASNHRVLVIDAGNRVTVLAGDGTPGDGGDGGPAAGAQLHTPSGVAVDGAGNVYIADSGNHRVRMVTTTGVILTIAGTGTPGFGGDGGPAHEAALNYPMGLVAHGNRLFVADTGNSRVRMITSEPLIYTIAGSGAFGSAGDGGPSTLASLSLPTGLAVDTAGRLLIADFGAHRVRRVDPAGVITTAAGTGTPGSAGDGGPAVAGELNGPFGVDTAPSGQVVISELLGHRVRVLGADGRLATLAGTGAPGPIQTPPRAATDSPVIFPSGVAFDGLGDLFVADVGNYRLTLARRVVP